MPPPPNQTPQQQQPPYLPAKGNQYGPAFPYGPGHLFGCQYLFWKHDQKPLVLMTSKYHDGRIAGLNLHYLTFPYVRWLIQHYCGNNAFRYVTIKGDKYIVNAFRTYKFAGLRRVRGIDCDFLKTVLHSLRSFDPEEIEAMRQEVNKQLRERMNMKADEYSRQHRDKARGLTRMVYPEPYPEGYDVHPNIPLKDTRSPLDSPALERPGASIPGNPASQPGRPI